jgi:hypothetical protein
MLKFVDSHSRVCLKNGTAASINKATGTEYASVDVQDIGLGMMGGSGMKQSVGGCNKYRSLQPPHLLQAAPVAMNMLHSVPPPPPPLLPQTGTLIGQQQQVYNLGHYFPRVSSEPPQRKLYHTTAGRGQEAAMVLAAPSAAPKVSIYMSVQEKVMEKNQRLPGG